mmetsp:Transcript_90644/g.280329  ORF Transcript_90644/g.280329 Transcript_90644/m.280329 type:complete len:375 (+) Transcript_90644:420-1544(+)
MRHRCHKSRRPREGTRRRPVAAPKILEQPRPLHLCADGREQLREHHAQRVHVSLHAARPARELLGARVGRGAHAARLGQRRRARRRAAPGPGARPAVLQRHLRAHHLGQPEVAQAHRAVAREEDVRGLEVTVHAPLRMQVRHGRGALLEDPARFQGPAPTVLRRGRAVGPGGVPLGYPRRQRVLAAELRLYVEHRAVARDLPGEARPEAAARGRRARRHNAVGRGRRLRGPPGLRPERRAGQAVAGFAEDHATVRLVRREGDARRGVGLRRTRGPRRQRQDEPAGSLHLHPREDIRARRLHPGAMVARDVRVLHAGPRLCFAQDAALDAVSRVRAVDHRLHSVLAAIQAMPTAPHLAEGAAPEEFDAVKLPLKS